MGADKPCHRYECGDAHFLWVLTGKASSAVAQNDDFSGLSKPSHQSQTPF